MTIARFEDIEAWQKEYEKGTGVNRGPDNLSRDEVLRLALASREAKIRRGAGPSRRGHNKIGRRTVY